MKLTGVVETNQRRAVEISRQFAVEKARELILRHGWNATAYQILNPGIELWFADAGDAVIGYVTRAHQRVVAGAPICSLDRISEVAAEFDADAARHDEHVCYFGAGERLENALVNRGGWSAAPLGAQPSWNPANWGDIVRRKPSLRAQLNRARNKGVTIAACDGASERNIAPLEQCLKEWLATRGLPPLHFLVEPDTLSNLEDRFLVVARRGDDAVGFLVASPIPSRNGWLIEQIIRGRRAPNGTAELMVDAAMREATRRGADYVTLGLAPLSRHSRFDLAELPRWLRFVLKWVEAHGKRFYNFKGLDAFKSKLEPDNWEDIVALADARPFPPRALWAIAAAFSQGNPVALILRAVMKAVTEEFRRIPGRPKRVRP